jgi:hypothetical protein
MRTNRNISKSAEFWRKVVDDESLNLEERKNAARELRLLGNLQNSMRFRATIRKLKLQIQELKTNLAAEENGEVDDGLNHSGDPAYVQIPRIGLDADGKRRTKWRKRTAADGAPNIPVPSHQPAESECNSTLRMPLTPVVVKPSVESKVPDPALEDVPKEKAAKSFPISLEDHQGRLQWLEHQGDRQILARAHEANLVREEDERLKVRRIERDAST